jgi:serine/threonine-protein kinase
LVLASTERSFEEYAALPRDSTASFQAPSAFGRYRVVHQVGVGVLGPVFRGYDPEQDRVVAIKAFSLDLTPEQAAGLAAEFGRLAELAIPHGFIIAPLAGGSDGSTPYLVEEYFVAESTDVALKQYGPPPLADALRLIGQLAGALDAAAAAGVHHGALHPRDVLVAPHEMRLTGLGIVPALERVGFRAQPRIPYAAPERMAGQPVTHLSDVFSLACLSFELLTGRRPVPAGDTVTVETGGIPAADASALSEVFARVLGERPEDRYPSALAFAAALKHALTGAPLQGGAEIETPRPRRAARERRPAALPFDDEPPVPPAEPSLTGAGDAPLTAPIGAGEAPGVAVATRHGEAAAEDGRAARRARPPKAPPAPEVVLPSLLDAPDAISERAPEVIPAASDGLPAAGGEDLVEPAAVPLDQLESATAFAPEPAVVPVPERAQAVDLPAEPAAAYRPAPPTESEPEIEAQAEPEVEARAEPETEVQAEPEIEAQAEREEAASFPAAEPEPVIELSPLAAPDEEGPGDPMFSAFSPETAEPPVAAPPRRNLVALFGMLAIGLVIGFAAGYLVAPRGASGPVAAPAVPVPAVVPAVPAPSPPAAEPAPSAEPTTAAEPATAAQPTTPAKVTRGTLVINSKPAKARVFVDGREAGKTPLTLRGVKAGTHNVRLELAGYHPWTLTVRVTAGAQRKVTASLRRRTGE